jgi:DNA-binding NtrC family response regulator
VQSTGTEKPLIVVVDDDPLMRDMMRRILESLDYEVSVAASARAAISSISERRPEVVLTDVYMPDGDGLELLNWIRSQPDPIPVVVMSGSGASEFDALAAAKSLGATNVIEKPFRLAQVVEMVDRARRRPLGPGPQLELVPE